MIEPVRPIALEDIEQRASGSPGRCCARRWSGSTLARDGPDIRLKLENLQPTNAYKIRGAANAVAGLSAPRTGARRLDDQRRQCRPGRRLCGAGGRHPLHGGRDRDGAADQARPDGGARRDASSRSPTRRRGRPPRPMLSPAWTAPSSIRSTITISSPATAPWASRSSRMRPTCAPSSPRSAAAG